MAVRSGPVARPGPGAEPLLPVITFQLDQGGNGDRAGAGSSGTGTGPGATPRCQVQSFGMTFNPWNRQWPDGSGDYALRLPVSFALRLATGTSRADCVIGQDKKGQVEYGRFQRSGGINIPVMQRVANRFPNWTRDAKPGQSFWWDGSAWHSGRGSWGWAYGGLRDERATFHDEPGFATPSTLGLLLRRGYPASSIRAYSFPIYWGGFGKSGHFRFRTFIKDAATNATVRQLTWGMLIKYASPSSGSHYFYT